jgi:hypothetical protein
MADTLWIVQAAAHALASSGYSPGAKHSIMGYAKAADRETAHELVQRKIEQGGWEQVELLRSAVINPAKAASGEEAVVAAQEHGVSLVIYGQAHGTERDADPT